MTMSEIKADPGIRLRLLAAVLLCFASILAVYLIPPEQARQWIRYGGYYLCFLIVALFLLYFVPRMRQPCRSLNTSGPRWTDYLIWLGLGSWLLFIHADFGFKIAMDDYILASTAENLHQNRDLVTTRTLVTYGNINLPADVYVDKRPWLYPFFVSVLHDLSGFRIANSMILNALLGVGLLGLSFWLGWRFAGWRGGGLAVLLWASLPLLAQNATGGGMELLSVCLLGLVLCLAVRYLESPSRRAEGELSLAAVLLAYSRYETGLFLLSVLAVIVLGWWRNRRVLLSWGSVVAAPLLLGMLLQLKAYAGDERGWELTGGRETAMSLDYVVSNLPHAINFFFSPDDSLANSLLLSLAGVVCLFVFLLMLRTEWGRYWRDKPVGLVTVLFLPSFLLQFGIVLSFHAGRLDSPFVSRYALTFHFLLLLVVLAVMEFVCQRQRRGWAVAYSVVAMFLLTFTLPMNAKAVFSERSFAIREQQWLEQISGSVIRDQSIVLDRLTISWSLRDWVAYRPEQFLEKPGRFLASVRSGAHPAVFFVERLTYQGNRFVPDFAYARQLQENFITEVVAEQSFRPFSMTRIHRIVRAASKADE